MRTELHSKTCAKLQTPSPSSARISVKSSFANCFDAIIFASCNSIKVPPVGLGGWETRSPERPEFFTADGADFTDRGPHGIENKVDAFATRQFCQQTPPWARRLRHKKGVRTASLDKRPHPHRMYLSLDPDLTGRSQSLLASSCLKPDAAEYNLLALESEMQENHIKHIFQAMQRRGMKLHNNPMPAMRRPRV